MIQYYNQKRTPAPVFYPGDYIFLNTLNIKTTCPFMIKGAKENFTITSKVKKAMIVLNYMIKGLWKQRYQKKIKK